MPAWGSDTAISSALRSSFDDLAQDVVDAHDADGFLGGVGVLKKKERGEKKNAR